MAHAIAALNHIIDQNALAVSLVLQLITAVGIAVICFNQWRHRVPGKHARAHGRRSVDDVDRHSASDGRIEMGGSPVGERSHLAPRGRYGRAVWPPMAGVSVEQGTRVL